MFCLLQIKVDNGIFKCYNTEYHVKRREIMKSWIRKWKRSAMKLAMGGDVNYAYHIFKQADKDYRSEIRRLRNNKLTQQEIIDKTESLNADVSFYYDEYKEIRSRKWQREAIKLSVPLPDRPSHPCDDDPSGYWEFVFSVYTWVLTDKGIHYVRREIREVQRTEHERRLRWVTPIIAVLALIISIISVSGVCIP